MHRKGFLRQDVGLHLTALFVVVACLAAGYWQLTRALGGNGLSWAYTFEWPFFACYCAYMWWKLLHETPREGQGERQAPAPAPMTSQEEERLAAYNRYLASLADSDRRQAVSRRQVGQ